MGGITSILSPLRKLTWVKSLEPTSSRDYGRPFVEMIQDHHLYGGMIEVKCAYEMKLVHGEGYHWYLLVRPKDSKLPYVSLEIRTINMSDLVPCMYDIEAISSDVSSDVGFYEGTLLSLCKLADRVVREMGSYGLLASNCQTFCNELLKKMGKPKFPTTTEFLDREFDLLGEALGGHSQSNRATNHIPLSASRSSSSVSNSKVNQPISIIDSSTGAGATGSSTWELEVTLSSNVPSMSIGDLASLKKILIPIKRNWKEIGEKLSINPQMLEMIEKSHHDIAEQCLREMLREYLLQTDPPPSWVDLANAVDKHSHQVAKSIIKRAESIQQTAQTAL